MSLDAHVIRTYRDKLETVQISSLIAHLFGIRTVKFVFNKIISLKMIIDNINNNE